MPFTPERFAELTHRLIADLGATFTAGAVVLGDRLGLYRALADGPMPPLELARRTGTAPRYVEEWLRGQAAGGYVRYDPGTGEYSLTPEQSSAFADPDGASHAPGIFALALSVLQAAADLPEAFRLGETATGDVPGPDGCAPFHVPWYAAHVVPTWLPALDGVVDKLRRGALVADVPSGPATSTIAMAQAFPRTRFVAVESRAEVVDAARKRVAAAGLGDRVSVETCLEQEFSGGPYDLVTTFSALHEMGDPLELARHVHEQLDADGTWLVVEPPASDTLTDNLTPTGRLYYAMSVFLCVRRALSREGGYSLGALAGEQALRRLATAAGFRRFRLVSRGPFTVVYEARP